MGVMKLTLFGFPVQIHPLFWLVAYLLVSGSKVGFASQLLFAAIILASLLVHELGHALAARSAGQQPQITIHAFGGLTRWIPNRPLSKGKLIGITLAGPAGGIALALLSFLSLKYLPRPILAIRNSSIAIKDVLQIAFQVNAVWSIVNLLPVLPFDGGQLLAHALEPKRRRLSATLSAIFGVAAAIGFWELGWKIAAVMFGISGIMEYRSMQRARQAALAVTPEQIERALAEARLALEDGDADRALQLAHMVGALHASPEQQRQALELGAWAALATGQHAEARHALRVLSPGPIDILLQAAILEAHGDTERAVACLRQAREAGDARPQVSASLVRVLLKDGRFGEAAAVTRQILCDVPPDDARRVAKEALDGGRAEPSAELSFALFERTRDPADAVAAARAYLLLDDRSRATDAVNQAVAAGQSTQELDEGLVQLINNPAVMKSPAS
jgi:Zn-dependent protease